MPELVNEVIGPEAFKQVQDMLALLDTAAGNIRQINATVAGVTLEVKGAKTVEDLATNTVKLKENTEALKKSTADYNAIAAKTEQVLKDVSGSQSDNLRLYAQYKAELAKNREEQSKLDKQLKNGTITTAEYKKVVAGLVQEEQRAKIAQGELSASIKAGIKEQQASAGSIDQMSQRLGQLKDAYRRMSEAERESTGGQAMLKSIQELDPAVKELNASTGNFQANVGNYQQTFNSATAVLRQTREELQKQLQVAEQGSDAYNAISTQVQQLDTVLESSATRMINARQAQRALREVSVELASTLGVESEAFRTVTELAGGYADQIGDVQSVINQSASDTQGLDEVIGAAEGLAGAFGVAQSTAVLFGLSEEEAAASTQKLAAIMTVLQSLQAVQNALQSESSAMAFVNTGRTKAQTIVLAVKNFLLTGSIRATVADTAATGANTAATVVNTAATTAGSTALRIFRTALLLTGIGAIVVILIAAAKAMGLFGDETIAAAAETEELKKEADDLAAALDKVAASSEKIRNSRSGGLDNLRRELELMKARGAAAGDIQAAEEKLAEAELSNLRIKAFGVAGLIKERQAAGIDAQDLQDQLADINREGLDKRNAIEAGRLAFTRSQNEKAETDAKAANDKRVKAGEELAKKLDDLRKRDQKAAADIALLKLRVDADALKEVAEDEEASFEDRLAASASYYGKEIEAARFAANVEKAEAGKTATELALIDAQLGETVFNLTKDANRQKLALLKTAFGEEVAVRLAGIDRISEDTDSRQQDALNALAKSLRKEKITVEQYEEEKAKIQYRFETERLQNSIDYFQEQIKEIKAAGGDTLDLQRQLNAAQATLYKQDADNFVNEQKKKIAAQQQLKDALTNLGREIFTTLVSLQQSLFQKDGMDIDSQLAEIQKRGDAEKKEIEQSTDAAQTKQRKIAESEALTQARREQLEQRKRALAVRAAQFEKASNIGAIIGETSLAVIRTIAAPPGPPATLPLAAVIAAIGALQLARAIAVPLPQYAKGRKGGPAELAITGEKGRERIEHPDGSSYYTPDGPTLTYLPAGANVITHEEVMADARASTQRATSGEDSQSQYTAMMTARYYEKGFDKVVAAINNKKEVNVTETHFNITERGIQKISGNGNAWTEYINASV